MKKEILSEVNRFREIIGLTLLTEGKIPSSFIEDLAKIFNKSSDELFVSIEKKEIPALEKTLKNALGDDSAVFAKNLQKLKAGTLSPTLEDKLLASLIRSSDNKIKNLVETTFIKSNPDLNKIIGRFTKRADGSYPEIKPGLSYDNFISRMSPEQYTEYVKLQNQLIDATDLGVQMKKYLKERLASELTSLKTKSITTPSVENMYKLYEIQAKNLGKKPISMSELKLIEDDIINAGATKKEMIDYMIELSGNDKNFLEKLKTFRQGKQTVEGMATDSVDAAKKGLSGWTKGSIIVLGLALLGGGIWYNWDRIRYGSNTDVWKETYKEAFSDLPKNLQNFIIANYAGSAGSDPNIKTNIKSLLFDNDVLTITFMDNTKNIIKKVTQGENEYWSKVEGESPKDGSGVETEVETSKQVTPITDDEKNKVIEKLGGKAAGFGIADLPFVKKIDNTNFTFEDANGKITNVTL
jgi:hypothetical protein